MTSTQMNLASRVFGIAVENGIVSPDTIPENQDEYVEGALKLGIAGLTRDLANNVPDVQIAMAETLCGSINNDKESGDIDTDAGDLLDWLATHGYELREGSAAVVAYQEWIKRGM